MPAAVISQPLVLPTRQEARLNGVRPVQSAQPVDPRKQIEAAIHGVRAHAPASL